MNADIELVGKIGVPVVVAVGLSVVAYLRGWVGTKTRPARRRLAGKFVADHGPIAGGWFGRNISGSQRQFRIEIKCAPSSTLSSQRHVSVEEVAPWARAVLGESAHPAWPGPDHVRFEAAAAGTDSEDALALVWPTGLLEAAIPIRHALDSAGLPTVDVMDLARTLATFVLTVRSGIHRSLYGRELLDRRRLDWHIAVTPAIALNGNYTLWSSLVFPERIPPRTSAGRPPTDDKGFGDLLDVDVDLSPHAVVMTFLADYIKRAGYYETTDCLADIDREVAIELRNDRS